MLLSILRSSMGCLPLDFLGIYYFQVAALLSRYLEYVGGKEDDGNAKIIQDSLQVQTGVRQKSHDWCYTPSLCC